MNQSRARNQSLALSLVCLIALFLTPKLGHCIDAQAPQKSELNLDPLKVKGLTFEPVRVSPYIAPGDTISVRIKLALDSGFHAYLNQFKLEIDPNKENLYISELQVRPTVKFKDPITKKSKVGAEGIFEVETLLDIPKVFKSGEYQLDLILTYQACAKDYCLLPKKIPIQKTLLVGPISKSNQFLGALSRGWFYALLFVFIAGILTSFTPCIFPMIPITLAVIGSKGAQSRLSGFITTLVYVLGIAITYAILGVFAAKSGALFGSYLGHPIVVSVIALVFVLMGFSMFGAFEVQMPAFVTNKLSGIHTKRNLIGAFISGLVAGVVASPCVGPVLVGILTYVAQSQNTLKGFVLLFVFALGLGQIFLILGTFQSILQKMPKSGPWMDNIKKVFGVIMFAMAIYYVYPVAKAPFQNWFSKNLQMTSTNTKEEHHGPMWIKYSDLALAQAIADKQPVIIDFNAEWCLACKELESKTFSDPEVLELGSQFVWLTFDATNPSDQLEELQKRYEIAGLPHIVIYDSAGRVRNDLTLTGFEPPTEFIKRMRAAK